MQVSGGIEWVMVVNLIIWTGLFLYLRRLDRQVRALESSQEGPALEREP
jgi:CcmD family protein